jgi:putative transposase
MDLWAYTNNVILDFSRRGKPTDNATIESFNGRLREDCLNVHWFASLEDAQQKVDAFRWDYNEHHPPRTHLRSGPKYPGPSQAARQSYRSAPSVDHRN